MDGQTDNQQRKFNEIDIAWLAGFIDGEGSIGIKVQKYMNNRTVFYAAPYVQIVNTDNGALKRVDDILKALHVGHYIDSPKPRKAPFGSKSVDGYKPMWRVLINGLKRCQAFLSIISPYLVVKRLDASLVSEFIGSRISKHYKHLPYSEHEIEIINNYRRITRKNRPNKEISLKSPNDYTQDTLTSVKV